MKKQDTRQIQCHYCGLDLTDKPRMVMPTSGDNHVDAKQSLCLCGPCEKVYWGARWEEFRIENVEARKFKKQSEDINGAKVKQLSEIVEWLRAMEHNGLADELLYKFENRK